MHYEDERRRFFTQTTKTAGRVVKRLYDHDQHVASQANEFLAKPVTLSRRNLLRLTTLSVAGGALAGEAMRGGIDLPDKLLFFSQGDGTPQTTETPSDSFHEPFDDVDANHVTKEKGITAGDFFVVRADLMPKMKAFLNNELYPIYPPAIFAYKDLIYAASAEHNVPPNIIATIMTIESAGQREAESGAGAQGLFQIMPPNYEGDGVTEQMIRQPATNIRYGMRVYNYFLGEARKQYEHKLPENDPRLFARALMGYNGGNSAIEYERPPSRGYEESWFYGDHVIRMIATMEIADGLRSMHFSDQEIMRKMQSDEISGRAHALGEFHNRSLEEGRGYSLDAYERQTGFLAAPTPWEVIDLTFSREERTRMKADYEQYRNNPTSRLPYPASPGLRIWMHLGGRGLVEQEPKNTAIDAWYTIDSRQG